MTRFQLSIILLFLPTIYAILSCSPDDFTFPSIPGAKLVSIDANQAVNYTATSLKPGTSKSGLYTISFCNVTVTYTHPGWNDIIKVQVWLPREWNNRLQALGGGGYSSSFGSFYMTQAVAEGYVAIDTDSGHESGMVAATDPSWVLTSPGNVNLYLLEDFGSRALHEVAVIGKAITQEFQGMKPHYSYFSGCSGGGRQGLMIAQRYPHDFDGILAVAPAINIETFIPAAYWAQQVMNNLNTFPPPCEIEAFTQAAIDACDELDGIKDRIIAEPSRCTFQASDMVGQSFQCGSVPRNFTTEGAMIVQAAWDGPKADDISWYGLNKDADLTSAYITTSCQSENCTTVPSSLLTSWFKYFIVKDPDFVVNTTMEEFFMMLKQSQREYFSMLGTADPDLSDFREAGGKIIGWHGLADEIIPPGGTVSYYKQVLERDATAESFFKFFEVPGVGHCYGGPGHMPNDALEQLLEWVENGTVPDRLLGVNDAGYQKKLRSFTIDSIYDDGDLAQPATVSARFGMVQQLS